MEIYMKAKILIVIFIISMIISIPITGDSLYADSAIKVPVSLTYSSTYWWRGVEILGKGVGVPGKPADGVVTWGLRQYPIHGYPPVRWAKAIETTKAGRCAHRAEGIRPKRKVNQPAGHG